MDREVKMYKELYAIDTTPEDVNPCIKCKGSCNGNTKLFLFPGEHAYREEHGLKPNESYIENGEEFIDCKLTGEDCDPTITCKCSPIEIFIKNGKVEKLNIVDYCEKKVVSMDELKQIVKLINGLIERHVR